MQIPIRKPGKYTHQKPDPHLTEAKFNELKNKLERLKKYSHPRAVEEVKRLAEMGDFSDNAAYSMAKGRLRGINQRILDIEDHLKRSLIITPLKDSTTVQLGHHVTVEVSGRQKTYLLLGSAETDPSKGIISHNSPIGSALIGRRVGDIIIIKTLSKDVEYKIVRIE